MPNPSKNKNIDWAVEQFGQSRKETSEKKDSGDKKVTAAQKAALVAHAKQAHLKAWEEDREDPVEELKESLGENAPKTLEDFRDLKYSSGDWEQFQSYRKAIESGKLSAMADFDLYKKTSGDIDKMLVGVTTSNGIQIKSKSDYFIARVIGSVEERQSGVDLNDVLSVLTDPNTKVFAEKIASNGTVSQKFKLGNIEVTVNPKTGKLIRVRP